MSEQDKQAQLKAAHEQKQAIAKKQAMAKRKAAAQAQGGAGAPQAQGAAVAPQTGQKPVPKVAPAPAAAPAKASGGAGLTKRGILKLDITDEKMLYSCFMPFVKGCGIFMPTSDDYKVGAEAFLLMTLPDGKGKFSTSAKVVWVNPKQKMGRREPGIGLQIKGKDAGRMHGLIEEILGKKLTSPLPTSTM